MHLDLKPNGPAPRASRNTVTPELRKPGGIAQRYAIDGADWLWDSNEPACKPMFRRLRLNFSSKGKPLHFQVSGDQYFWLMLNGHVIARGPDVSPPWHYGFAEYKVAIPAGKHQLEAFVWWVGDHAPEARMTDGKAGFVLAGIGAWHEKLSTGIAPWKIARVAGYEMDLSARQAEVLATGKNGLIDARAFFKKKPVWKKPVVTQGRLSLNVWGGRWVTRIMEPSNLPEMPLRPVAPGRFCAALKGHLGDKPLPPSSLENPLLNPLQGLLGGKTYHRIPANSKLTLVWDLENYYSGWPELLVSGGRGTRIKQIWSESFYETPDCRTKQKGNRREMAGKYFNEGLGDVFVCDGGRKRRFIPYWWRCGRYCLLEISTASEALTLHHVGLIESGHPYQWIGGFSCDQDARISPILDICRRTLEVSSWDSYEDSPYFEQLQYIGDTRLEMLITYVLNANASLPLRALELIDQSRHQWHGLTASRFPCRGPQFISTFSLIWIWCVRDLLFWRNEPSHIQRLIPGVRLTLDLFSQWRNADGLLEDLPGWPFIDWVTPDRQSAEVWQRGVPVCGREGISSLVNMTYLLALQNAVEIEEKSGEPELARKFQRLADATAASIRKNFWNPDRRALMDDASGRHWSTQAQIYGILTGLLTPAEGGCALDLASRENWVPPSYMFRHYEFEALRRIGRAGEILQRLDIWQKMVDKGSCTVWENLEPSRSDCHAWSSHPLFHLPCSVAGIRPASHGFATVEIAPQPGSLRRINATIAHPKGKISTELTKDDDGKLTGSVNLPEDITGTFVYGGQNTPLLPGVNKISTP